MGITLPTPSTSHVSFDNVYEPAEDSFLLLDTISSKSEIDFLQENFPTTNHAPLVVEFGTGSGVVLAFLTAYASTIFGHSRLLTLGIDVNRKACKATVQTVQQSRSETHFTSKSEQRSALFLGVFQGDLGSSLRAASVDILIFNPPYVPTEESPQELRQLIMDEHDSQLSAHARFEADSRLLALSYAGGVDGMETTNQFLDQLPRLLHPTWGVAYLLLCAGNKPDQVMADIKARSDGLDVLVVGHSGKKAGRETLQILRIFRASTPG